MTNPNRRPVVVVVSSRYRCREHTDRAVTSRGAGCIDCENTPRKPRRRRVVDASKQDASLPTWAADPNRTRQ